MRTLCAVVAAAGLGVAAHAQTIELRIIERTGQPFIAIGGGDNVLSFAVQGRLIGGNPSVGIGGFFFDIVMPGEPDSYGTITRERISNNDRTPYTGAPAISNVVGVGGVAFQYSYLAGISASFNGQINATGGTFTNSAGNQEIGNIAAACTANALIGIPGIDVGNGDLAGAIPAPNGCNDVNLHADCNPDTWNATHTWNSGTGTAPVVGNGDTAAIAGGIGPTYLGVGGGWVDLYRFRYTVTNTTPRGLTVTFSSVPGRVGAQRTDQFFYSNSQWSTVTVNTPVIFAGPGLITTPAVIPVGNPGACCDTLTGSCAASVDTGCAGTFTAGAACGGVVCEATGACCTGSSCSVGAASACSGGAGGGNFHAGAACNAGPGNPTTCCDANFDGEGGVQVKDIFEWINAFFAGDMRADANHDGVLRAFDIFAFLQAWFTGCS